MGAIKDVVDLVTQLEKSLADRRAAEALLQIHALLLDVQAQHETLQQTNSALREERLGLKEEIVELKRQIQDLKSAASHDGLADRPVCPNCSTTGRPHYLSPMGPDFEQVMGSKFRCPQCNFLA